MAAHKSKLGALHELVTRAFSEGIELDLKDDIFNPALLSAASKFLKDNEISADVKADDDLAELRQKLVLAAQERREAGKNILRAVGAEDLEP